MAEEHKQSVGNVADLFDQIRYHLVLLAWNVQELTTRNYDPISRMVEQRKKFGKTFERMASNRTRKDIEFRLTGARVQPERGTSRIFSHSGIIRSVGSFDTAKRLDTVANVECGIW